MLLDAALPITTLDKVAEIARSVESLGFSALWSTETQHDPFLPGALVAEHTRRLVFGTGVAIAFARSPANLAYSAWDLAQVSAGRFILGLGTQVKAHIERRFGMPWPESVVKKLREQVQAVRLFWRSWQTGEPFHFKGEYYNLSLMSPFFNPGPIDHPEIPVYLAGVNPALARLSGEIAQGFLLHPLHSQRYLDEVLLPAIEQGALRSSRTRNQVQVCANAFVITSPEERSLVQAQISFYAATPSYRPVMALHGWEEVAGRLSRLAARGQWMDMPGLVSDEMVDVFSVQAEPADLPAALLERYRGRADRLTLYLPFIPGERDAFWARMVSEIQNSG